MEKTYIANYRMAKADGTYHEVGDVVPEAHDWPWQIRESYIRNSRLKESIVVETPAKGRKEQPAHA
jgi:hypothetical protein